MEKLAFPKITNSPLSLTAQTNGLSETEAKQRLKKFGFNEPVIVRKTSALTQILRLFTEPLIIILLIASLISGFVGESINAVIIALMVILSISLTFVQTARSQKAAERLRLEISPAADVLRDGTWQVVRRREIVPGDFVRLSAGDLVPADARLLESRDLHVQEAALTGESLPVEKEAGNGKKAEIFLGTSIISGTAKAIVTATGRETAFGKIAERLTEKAPETDFERGMRSFGYLIARAVFLLVLFVFFVNTILNRPPLESLFFSIALAIGLTPEFLPMVTSVTLGQGALRMAREKVIVKHLAAIQNFGSMDILCSDKTGTLTSGVLSLKEHLDAFGNSSKNTLRLAYVNSSNETGIRSPLDQAILDHDVRQSDLQKYRKIDEIPFDFERRRMSIVVETENEHLLICKGAPESVLAVCTRYETNGENFRFDEQSRIRCERLYQVFSSQGSRVLAVAYQKIATQQPIYRADDERELTLAGFLTFADAPLESAAETLKILAADGVRVKILTGDNELVTRYVCRQVGIGSERIVLGEEIEQMTDPALAHVAEEADIFARVSPMQKNRVLLALKQRGHVVGFLGDGINDAPSLRSADVGISVASATDVAKEAAEIVLQERSLRVLHNGIIEGRKSFGNVMKYLLMGTSSNFGNVFSMAAATLFLPFLPMLPTQIILNNFLYDLAQVMIPSDRVDQTFTRKPHHWDVKLIRDFMLYIGPVSSIYDFLTFFVLLKVFAANEQLFHTGWFVESLATQTLVVFIIRTAGNPFKSPPSLALALTVLSVVSTAVILPFTPLAPILGFVPLPLNYFLFLVGATLTYLALVELVKRRLMRRLVR